MMSIMPKTPAVIFATAAVGFLSSAFAINTVNSFLKSISPTAPEFSTFWSILGFIICAVLAWVFRGAE